MTLVIALNIIFCAAVIVAVVTPLAWAVRTQERNLPVAIATAWRIRTASGRVAAASMPR
jgi:hypothetical protein